MRYAATQNRRYASLCARRRPPPPARHVPQAHSFPGATVDLVLLQRLNFGAFDFCFYAAPSVRCRRRGSHRSPGPAGGLAALVHRGCPGPDQHRSPCKCVWRPPALLANVVEQSKSCFRVSIQINLPPLCARSQPKQDIAALIAEDSSNKTRKDEVGGMRIGVLVEVNAALADFTTDA